MTHPPHSIDGRVAHLVRKVVPLDEADAVLAGDGAFHLDGALDHAVNDIFGDLAFLFVEEEDR